MRIPDPYFKNVPNYGNLSMEKIIVEYDYPLLFVLKDVKGGRFLCICFDTRGSQQWFLTPITNADLIALLEDQLELQAPFMMDNGPKILATLDYDTREEDFTSFTARDVPVYAVPEAGEYLEAEPDEWRSYIQVLAADDGHGREQLTGWVDSPQQILRKEPAGSIISYSVLDPSDGIEWTSTLKPLAKEKQLTWAVAS